MQTCPIHNLELKGQKQVRSISVASFVEKLLQKLLEFTGISTLPHF